MLKIIASPFKSLLFLVCEPSCEADEARRGQDFVILFWGCGFGREIAGKLLGLVKTRITSQKSANLLHTATHSDRYIIERVYTCFFGRSAVETAVTGALIVMPFARVEPGLMDGARNSE
jgi:hypothetical protein